MARFWLQFTAVGLVVGVGLYYLLQVTVISVPFLIGIIWAYSLEPVVLRLENRGMERGAASMAVFVGSMVLGIILVAVVADGLYYQVGEFSASFPLAVGRLEQLILRLQQMLPFELNFDLRAEGDAFMHRIQTELVPALPHILVNAIIGLLLVPIVTFFLMRDGRAMKKMILESVPNRYFEMFMMIFYRVNQNISGYIRGVVTEASLVGLSELVLILIGSALWDIKVDNVLLIAVVASCTNVVPFVGPTIGTVAGCTIALFSADPNAVLLVAGAGAMGHLLDNVVFAPLVLGGAVHVHPIAVIVLLVLAGNTLGILGMLVAVPLYAVTTAVVQEVHSGVKQHQLYFK